MGTDTNPELRAMYDHRVERARERLDWAQATTSMTAGSYDKAIKAAASIDELDEFRFEREQAEITLARCQGDVDRLLDWRAHETGAPR